MRKLTALLSAAAVAATLLPASSFAADRDTTYRPHYAHHYRHHYRHHVRPVAYEPAYGEPAYGEAYAADRTYTAGWGAPTPLIYPLLGAGIGAIVGAAVCPPCSIGGSAIGSGAGALVGAGIGAVGGTLVGFAAEPAYAQPRYVRY